MFTMFLRLVGDGFEVYVQPLFEQIVFNVQLLLTGHVHRIYTEIWESGRKVEMAGLYWTRVIVSKLVASHQSEAPP